MDQRLISLRRISPGCLVTSSRKKVKKIVILMENLMKLKGDTIMAGKNVITITEENFESEVVNADVPVLLDFWASWCAPCRMIAPTIEALSEEMAGKIKVGKVNVDEQPGLASAFRVMSIPTVTLTKGKSLLMQSIGVKPKDALKREIEAKI
jgi:thioredoxin 1